MRGTEKSPERSGRSKIHQLQKELKQSRSENTRVLRHFLEEQGKLMELAESLRYARHLHDALMHGEEQLLHASHEGFILNMPRETLGGDFFWTAHTQHLHIIAVADCTGHGIPGALMSVLGFTFLNQVIIEQGQTKPAVILQQLDRRMQETFRSSADGNKMSYDGFDIALCAIDTTNKVLHYAGAFRPALICGQATTQLNPNRYPIGGWRLETERDFRQHSFHYAPGDMLYLFTDGVVDQFGGPAGKKLTIRRFRELLGGIHQHSVIRQKEFLHEALLMWKGTSEQTDDMMLAGLRLN